MSDSRIDPDRPPLDERPPHRPSESFWPYAELPEHPTDEELAALDPDLDEMLFGRTERPFSVTLSFPPFEGEDYARAVELAKACAEYRTAGEGKHLRHRARFYPADVDALHALYALVGAKDDCDVLIDDRPVPFAREMWLPLLWLLRTRRSDTWFT